MRAAAAACVVAMLLAALPAGAQSQGLTLDVRNGRVTLDARDVSVAQVLERWSGLSGLTVVNGERLAGLRVTMRLDNATQREALDMLLRDAGGYIAASRPLASGGGTEIDRVLIVARTTATPATPQRATVTGRTSSATPQSTTREDTAAVEATAPGIDLADDDSERDQQKAPAEADRARADAQPSPVPPPIAFGAGGPPLVNGLTLDQLRANAVRTANDPVTPPPDASSYAARQREMEMRRQQAQQADAQTGPFGVRGSAAQPGTITAPPTGRGQAPPQAPPTSQP